MRLKLNAPLLVFTAGLLLCATVGALHFIGGGKGKAVALTLLTPHGDNIRQEIGAAFQSWYLEKYGDSPELVWVDQGGTSEDLRYVQARFAKVRQDGAPASIGIDLFFGGGTPPFRTLAKAGLLQPRSVSAAALEKIPPEVGGRAQGEGGGGRRGGIRLYSAEEGWYGVALSGFGILFNRALLAAKGLPRPESWADLARPELAGWVACVDPRGSGSAHVIYEIILQKYGWARGWEILTRMAANSGHFTLGASGVLPLVSTGEAAYTLAIDQYAWSLIDQVGGDKIGFLLPAGETVVTPDPAAILKGAPHPLEAARFLEFLLSETCQRLWALKPGFPGGPARLALNRMPVLPSVYALIDSESSVIRGNPFADSARDWTYSDSLTESRWALLNDALGLWMVDSHAEAAKAWARPPTASPGAFAVSHGVAGAAAKFFRAPAPWPEMEKLAARWKEETFRNQVMAGWAKELHD